MPSAATLTMALHGARNGAQTLPPTTSRSSLVRSLSVFASYLEGICKAAEGNYALCMQASKAISRTLDEVLDAPLILPSSNLTPARSPTSASATHSAGGMLTSPSALSLMLDNGSADIPDLDMLSGTNFDMSVVPGWTGINGDWLGF